MRDYITRIKSVSEEITRLRQEAAKGPLAPEQLFRLAQAHASLGQVSAAVGTLKRLLSAPGEKPFDLLLASAQLYSQCGQRGEAAKTLKDALGKAPPSLDPNLQRGMAGIFAEGGMNAEADACLNAFLRANPNDIDAWMQLAIVKDALGLVQDSQNAIIQAYRLNANEAARRLQSSEQLQRIAAPLFRRR
jgi:predicted Zn-dependent protease